MLVPNAANCGFADPLGASHASATPMRRIRKFRIQGGFNNCWDVLVANSGNAPRERCILFRSRGAQRQVALTPVLDGWSGNIQHFGNVLAIYSVGGHLYNSRTMDNSQWHCPAMLPLIDCGALFRGTYDLGGFSAHNPKPYTLNNYMSSYLRRTTLGSLPYSTCLCAISWPINYHE